jgi:hypothetical protein
VKNRIYQQPYKESVEDDYYLSLTSFNARAYVVIAVLLEMTSLLIFMSNENSSVHH